MTKRPDLTARNQEMVELRKSGWTYLQLGERYSLTTERVRQIILAHNATVLNATLANTLE